MKRNTPQPFMPVTDDDYENEAVKHRPLHESQACFSQFMLSGK